jgi:hypothetical protein
MVADIYGCRYLWLQVQEKHCASHCHCACSVGFLHYPHDVTFSIMTLKLEDLVKLQQCPFSISFITCCKVGLSNTKNVTNVALQA